MDFSVTIQPQNQTLSSLQSNTPLFDLLAKEDLRGQNPIIAASVDGHIVDLSHQIQSSITLEWITLESALGKEVIRHSAAHLLAHAIKELYPESQITIGPVTERGFYYDITCSSQLTPENFKAIEKKMKYLAKKSYPIIRHEWTSEKACKYFESLGEHYKVEIIKDLDEPVVSVYEQGNFIDLCRGPHLPNTRFIQNFKLLSVAGAYWRGNEKNEMLQRIYGTAFAKKEELEAEIHRLNEAKKRDHRKLGPEIGLFSFLNAAPAMPFFQKNGTRLYQKLKDYMRQQLAEKGYEEVSCPQLMSSELWKQSGHWEHYRDDMFVFSEGTENDYALKPMNCPGHLSLFGMKRRSYRELPVKMAEFTRVHRNERAGVTHGLFRTRTFSIDDGHIFCTEDQLLDLAVESIAHTTSVYTDFGFDKVKIKLATRPEDSLGSPEVWEQAEAALTRSLEQSKLDFEVAPGEGAFYGPKIEFHIEDSLERSWQCGTVQLDFNLPERFQLSYIDSENTQKRPIMIHRAIFGSFERFLGILIEHHAGHLPFWLTPVQIKTLSLTSQQEEYAHQITQALNKAGFDAEVDNRSEKLGLKIREAQKMKIPYMIIVGEQEASQNLVSIRDRFGETTSGIPLSDIVSFFSDKLSLTNVGTNGGNGH